MSDFYMDLFLNDHTLIERALVLLEKEAEKGPKLKIDLVETLIDFLLEYGDVNHNMKEEQIYFPLLLERGLPPQGPIAVMLEEHKMERRYLGEIKSMIDKLKATGELDSNFKSTFTEYAELTKNHIWKENDILYPMGGRFLTPEDEKFLTEQFVRIEKEVYGENGYTRNLTLINSLEKQHGGKVNLAASLPYDVLSNMLDTLPVELSFVDADDRVRYYSHQDKKKIFHRSLSSIGRTVQKCHPEKSVHLVNQILTEMKAGTREQASFWMDFKEKYIHISYYAVRDENGIYQGCVEMVQDIKPYRDLTGEKRLLDGE